MGIIVEAAPFLLLGTLASGIVEVFFGTDDLSLSFPRHPILATLIGCLAGLFFPVCECGTIPLARRLMRKGLPVPAGISFLLAAPVLNPIVIASTWAAFGFSAIFYGRLVITLVVALLIGVIFSQNHSGLFIPVHISKEKDVLDPCSCHLKVDGKISFISRIRKVAIVSGDEFFEMGRYLVAGAFLASLTQTLIPQSYLLTLGKGPLFPVLIMVLLAVVMSICSTVDAFIALAFMGTFSTGAILAFLVFGPMVDIKAILMYQSVFSRKIVIYLVSLSLLSVLVITVGINYFTGW